MAILLEEKTVKIVILLKVRKKTILLQEMIMSFRLTNIFIRKSLRYLV